MKKIYVTISLSTAIAVLGLHVKTQELRSGSTIL
jgi:hypothetical protein